MIAYVGIERFGFPFFFAYSNLAYVFVGREYGFNFDPEVEWDRKFIDRIQALDQSKIEDGTLKPTQLLAVMSPGPVDDPVYYKHLSPEFCIRWPDTEPADPQLKSLP